MLSRPPCRRTVLFFTTFCVWTMLAAPPVDAGLRDVIANVRDTMSCKTKAVFKPLRDFEWGMKNFERLNAEEYNRRTDQSMKEVMKECMEASENILSRGFGVEKIAGKARNLIASAKGAADRVGKWFGKDSPTPNDPRMALAVDDGERNFYEKETGVLGRNPLPATPDTVNPTKAQGVSVWDAPYESRSDKKSRWDQDVWDRPTARNTDPWGQKKTAWDQPYVDTDNQPESPAADKEEDPDYAQALDALLGGTTQEETLEDYTVALADLEQRAAEERLRKEREAKLAQQRAERKQREEQARQAELAKQLRAQRKAQLAQQRAANSAAWQNLGKAFIKGLEKGMELYSMTQGGSAPSGIPSFTPSTPSFAPSTPSYSSGSSGSSACQPTPTCRRVMSTIETRMASLEARKTNRMSVAGRTENTAKQYKVILDQMPACIATETRPQCRTAYQRDLEQVRQAYEEAKANARQWRGGY